MGRSTDVGPVAGHSKDGPQEGHSKNLLSHLDPQIRAAIVRSVIDAWGPLEVPALLQAPLSALISQAVAALVELADSEALTRDQSAELQGRIRAVVVLASAPGASAAPGPAEQPGSLFDVLAATLPEPSLVGSWDVAATAVAATAAVIGEAISAGEGGVLAAAQVVSAWPRWVA